MESRSIPSRLAACACAALVWLCQGCGSEPPPSPVSAIRAQIAAQNAEDLEGLLELYSPAHPEYGELADKMREAFEKADAHYELEAAEVIEQHPDSARVRYRVSATRQDRPAARIEIEGVYALAYQDGRWLITGSDVTGQEFRPPPGGVTGDSAPDGGAGAEDGAAPGDAAAAGPE